MEIKNGSIITTKDGDYVLKNMLTLYNPFNLTPITCFIVDVDGEEKRISEKDIISVKNNHIENMVEP